MPRARAGAHRRHPHDRRRERVRRGLRRSRAHGHVLRDHRVALHRRDRGGDHTTGPGAVARPPPPHPCARRRRDGGDRAARETRASRPRRSPTRAASRRAGTGRWRVRTRRTHTGRRPSASCSMRSTHRPSWPSCSRPPTRSRRRRHRGGARCRHGDAGTPRPHRGDGHPGRLPRSAFLDAARSVAQACREHDVIFGIAGIRDQELLTELVALGLRFVSAGTDVGFMAEAAGAQVRRLREIPVEKKDV